MRTYPRSRRTFAAIAVAALGMTAATPLAAQEFGFDARMGNMQFPWSQTSPITDSTFPSTNFFWGGDAWFSAAMGEDASVNLSYERDPVIRNIAKAAIEFERGPAKIEVGPLFGFLNTTDTPFSAGISAAVRFQWPGVAYVSMRSEGGTAISLLQSSSDPQARTEFAAGVYVPHAIISGLVSGSRFNELDADGYRVTDSLTRYAMTFEIFKKNVPYTTTFSLGYEQRSKYYAASATTDSLGAIVIGADTSAQVSEGIRAIAGISSGAYVFGLDALSGRGPGSSAFMFDAKLGMAFDLQALKERPKYAPEAPAPAPAPAPGGKTDSATTEKMEQSLPKLGYSSSLGLGLAYDAYALSASSIDYAAAAQNLRGGLWLDLVFPLGGGLQYGPEIGLYGAPGAIGTATVNRFDLPIEAKISFELGKLRLEGLAGPLVEVSASSGSSPNVAWGLVAEARARSGNLYASGGYVLGLGGSQSMPRFGIGYIVPLTQ